MKAARKFVKIICFIFIISIVMSSVVVMLTVNASGALTTGNVANVGLASYNDVTYFANSDDGWKLYKAEGDTYTKLSDDKVQYICTYENYIYYVNINDDNKVYRVSKDGTNRVRMINYSSSNLHVDNGYIYVSLMNSEWGIYRLDINDLSSITALNINYAYRFQILGDYIYYTNYNDNMKLYRAKKAGGDIKKLCDMPMQQFVIDTSGQSLFFINTNDENKIYSAGIDGSNIKKVSDERASFINISESKLYYSNIADGNKIYMSDKGGSNKLKLTDIAGYLPNIAGDFVYFCQYYENNSGFIYFSDMVKVKNDGKMEILPVGGSSEISSELYLIDRANSYLSKVKPKTTVATFKSNIKVKSGDIKIYDVNGSEVSSGYIGTGFKVKNISAGGIIFDELTIIIHGDINSNGEIDIVDLAMIRQYLLGNYKLDGIYYEAANVSPVFNPAESDKVVDIVDLAIMRQDLLGNINLYN